MKEIAVNFSNAEPDRLIGSIFVSVVCIDTKIYGKFRNLNTKMDPKLFNLIIRKLEKDIEFGHTFEIPAKEASTFMERYGSIAFNLINMIPKFWKADKIIIENPYNSKEEFVEKLLSSLTKNIRQEKLDIGNWIIEQKTLENKASLIAYFSSLDFVAQQINSIEDIWGKFGTGLKGDIQTEEFVNKNKECISIR